MDISLRTFFGRNPVLLIPLFLLLLLPFVVYIVMQRCGRTRLNGRLEEIAGLNEALRASNSELSKKEKELETTLAHARQAEETVDRMHEALGSASWRVLYNENSEITAVE